jgi:hypothetical protein
MIEVARFGEARRVRRQPKNLTTFRLSSFFCTALEASAPDDSIDFPVQHVIGGEQVITVDLQGLGEPHEFGISNPARLNLDLREGVTAEIPSENLALRREYCLREPLLLSQ